MKHYKINYGSSVMVIPKEAVLKKLPTAGEAELKFLLMFLACDSDIKDYEAICEEMTKKVSLTRAELDSALAFWRGAEIITEANKLHKSDKKVSKHATLPSYTGEELSRIIDENGLSTVIDECQRLLGKVFNVTEVNRIASLNSYLGLSSDFILMLFVYCSEQGKLSLKYIEKTAYELYDKGVDSLEKLEEYIKVQEQKHSLESKLRTLFGWGERSLTPSEKKHISQWNDEFSYDIEIITEAYNITVNNTNKFSLPYMSKILSNWYSKGFKSLLDVKSAVEAYEKEKNEKKNEPKDSFDADEFFELALKRSREKMADYTGG